MEDALACDRTSKVAFFSMKVTTDAGNLTRPVTGSVADCIIRDTADDGSRSA